MCSYKLSENTGKSPELYSLYRRIKINCCSEWKANSREFYAWYEKQFKLQDGRCKYCHLTGNTWEHYGKLFRGGRRGRRLEVDRIASKEPYSPDNCVLACYPCNNAKSDVFSYEKFLEIGQSIKRIKTII